MQYKRGGGGDGGRQQHDVLNDSRREAERYECALEEFKSAYGQISIRKKSA